MCFGGDEHINRRLIESVRNYVDGLQMHAGRRSTTVRVDLRHKRLDSDVTQTRNEDCVM